MFSSRSMIFLCLVLALVTTGVSWAGGTSGAQFLGVGVGARAMGLGGASVSLADDGTALFWNPAGLALVEGHLVSLAHVSWFEETTYQYATYSMPLGERAAFGAALEQGSVSWDNTGEGSFDASDFQGVLGYAARLRPNLGVGGSVKYISEALGDESAASYAVDLGVVYRLSERATFGAAARNLGPAISYVSDEDPLPATVVVGGSYAWKNLLLALDVEKVNDLDARTRFGVEYTPVPYLALRGGVVGGEESTLSSVMGGAGVRWDRWAVDYAYRPADIGGTHQFGLSAGFGGSAGLAAAGAADGPAGVREVNIPRSNLSVITDLAREAIAEAVQKSRLPNGSEVYTKQIEMHDASWLIQSLLLEELTGRGHSVMTGNLGAAVRGADGPPKYEIGYRIVSCETSYPRSWREWLVGTRKVERRTDVDIHFQLAETSGAVIWAEEIRRERREIIPGSRVAELVTP